jgi:tripartite ATP-independent transporter DctM subunit
LSGRPAIARAGEWLLAALFLLLALLPLIDMLGRPLAGFHVPGSASYIHQLTFYLTFLGGLVATWFRKHLTLSTAELLPEGRPRRDAHLLAGATAAAVCAVLTWGSAGVVMAERELGSRLSFGLPVWVGELVMPLGFAGMALSFAWLAAPSWGGRLLALGAAGAVFLLALVTPASPLVWLLGALLLASLLLGMPVFAAMAGLAALLFWKDQVPVSAVTAEIYRLVASPTLPAIPLLTATGFVLAETRAAERLVRFFRALFGWLPGGVAVLVAAVCALFTAFTGGSGVTIIALGGLVLPILLRDGYPERFSLGLVTASGSLGLLFPPSLPVILYSVVAKVPADQLFIGGLIPGFLLLVLVAAWGLVVGGRVGADRQAFSGRELLAAALAAGWELSIPVVMIGLFASGIASLLETAAFALAYTVFIACFVQRDLSFARDLPRVMTRAAALVGAVLILLASALGLTSWLVDAQIPDALLAWVQAHVTSPVVFLLVLNAVLLVLGSVLEIYSAIVVLTPLVVPLGAAFGIHPIHLGVIFLANLELGFLFPPVGLNLFLSSSRFEKPMTVLYRAVVPFLLILGLGVLLITYIPWMSLGLLELMGRG